MKLKLYIAGPMSDYPEHNFPAFHAEAARLRALGYEVVNPAEINPDCVNYDRLECLRADIRELIMCNGIALLPGWTKSGGARMEEHIAASLGMRIFPASLIVEQAEA